MTDPAITSGPEIDPGASFYLAGTWRVDPSLNLLTGPDGEQRVPDKFMQVLVYLSRNPGLVTRQDLMEAVWPDSVVVDEALTRAVSELRKLLGDEPREPRFIETIPKKGYRLLAAVTAVPAETIETVVGAPSVRRNHPWFRGLFAAVTLLIVVAGVAWIALRDDVAPRGPAEPLALTSLPGVEMHPALAPAGDRLAFVWEGEGGGAPGVFVTVVGEPGELRLAGGEDPAAVFVYPAWSHDSRHVAYCRTRGEPVGVFAVPANGGRERQLMGELFDQVPLMPDYSPDGTFLVFSAPTSADGLWGLHRLSLESGVRELLTRPDQPGHYDIRPRHSPDGRRIACIRSRSDGLTVALVPAAGGEVTMLDVGDRRIEDLAWTDDGERLVLTADDGLWEIDGGGGPLRLLSAGGLLGGLTTARDQRLLAYTEARGEWNVWEVSREPGASLRRLIASSRLDMRPAQSPDGRQVAFVSMRGGRLELWLADADGGNARSVPDVPGGEPDDPAWSPDGSRLAFTATAAGRLAICVLDVARGSVQVLTPPDRSEARPAWSPDGQWLYFCRRHEGVLQIWRRPSGGGDAELVTRGGGFRARVSADTETVYFMRALPDTSGLWQVDAVSGEEGLVCALAGEVLVDFGLGTDGPVLCTATAAASETYRIWQWRPSTGGRDLVGELTSRRPPRLDVHPTSGRILCDRTERLESDLVGLRNY